jgi:hypothetical protein
LLSIKIIKLSTKRNRRGIAICLFFILSIYHRETQTHRISLNDIYNALEQRKGRGCYVDTSKGYRALEHIRNDISILSELSLILYNY